MGGFSYMAKMFLKNYIFGYFVGPWEACKDHTGPILLSSYPLTHVYIYAHVKQWSNMAQYDKNFLNLNSKYDKNKKLSYKFGGGGVLGGPYLENFRAVIPHHRADGRITREKNNHQFFIYRPECEFFSFLALHGAWVAFNYQTGPILLTSYPLTYINLHVKYGSNLIRIV